MSFIVKLFQYVLLACNKYKIDDSHGVSHSMEILNYAHNIYNNELINYPHIEKHEKIIYVSAILHDMCDKKYTNETEGIDEINQFLQEQHMTSNEIDITKKIISTMSYSTVKCGFPELNEYQMAYHIVREADLLCAYDFERCMIYNMYKQNGDIYEAFINSNDLFEKRVLKHNQDKLFITDYSKRLSVTLHNNALQRIQTWKQLFSNPKMF